MRCCRLVSTSALARPERLASPAPGISVPAAAGRGGEQAGVRLAAGEAERLAAVDAGAPDGDHGSRLAYSSSTRRVSSSTSNGRSGSASSTGRTGHGSFNRSSRQV